MKKLHLLISAIIIGMTALFAVSCEEEPQIVKVESIEITNADPMELKVDGTATLDIKVLPEKATNPKFTVSVKDPNIASVSEEYVVTALAVGSTTITATTEDGGHTATITVNVTDDAPSTPTKVTIAEFLSKEVSAEVWYELTGTVTDIANDTYGNLTIEDETGNVFIYGLTSEKYSEYVYNEEKDRWSWTNNKSFSEIGLKVGDELTLVGTRGEYNGEPQVGGAYHVSHVDGQTEPMTFDIQVNEDGGNYEAVITPSDLERKYIAMEMNDYYLDMYVAEGMISEPTIESLVNDYLIFMIEMMYEEGNGEYTMAEIVDIFLNDMGLNGVYEEMPLFPEIGKNYVFAVTFTPEAEAEGLTTLMYLEKEEDVELPVVTLGLVEAQAKDFALSVTFPDNWLDDPLYPGDNHPIMFCWGKKSEIGNFTDEELVARDYAMLVKEAEEYGYAPEEANELIMGHQFVWTDYDAASPLKLSGTSSLYNDEGFEPGTEYLIYAYAMQADEAGNCFAASQIARLEGTTLTIQMVDINFEFSIDRVSPDSYGDLIVYFGVEADNADQRFTFYPVNEMQLQMFSKDGETIPTIDEVAEDVLQVYINDNTSPWWPVDLNEWTYFGYGFSGEYGGVEIYDNAEENKWYVVAAALDEGLNIVSEISYETFDITGLNSTDATMNLMVEGEQGTYTYSTNPDTTPYIVTTIAVDEMEQYLEDNYYYDTEVTTYVNAVIKNALASGSTVADYLAQNGTTAPVNETITVSKDTYVIAYTVYEKSAIANGIEYELLEAPIPEAIVVELTDASISFNSDWANYVFNFKWAEGNVRFLNNDGAYDYEIYDYTHTGHVILGQEYNNSDEKYKVNLGYTYKGDPNNEYSDDNLMAKKASIITVDNGDGTYTVTADIVYTDQTHYKYIYTGAIADEVINGRAEE